MKKSYMEEQTRRLYEFLQGNMGPGENKLQEITQHLWLSNELATRSLSQLRANDISALLQVGGRVREEKLREKYKRKQILYRFLDYTEGRGSLLELFQESYQFIHRVVSREKRILIFCESGVSLSPAVAAYYCLKRYYLTNFHTTAERTKLLVSSENYLLPDVFKLLRECRPCVCPSPVLLRALFQMENRLKEEARLALQEEFLRRPDLQLQVSEENSGSDGDSEDEGLWETTGRQPSIEEIINLLFEDSLHQTPQTKKKARGSPPSPREERFDELSELPLLASRLQLQKEATFSD